MAYVGSYTLFWGKSINFWPAKYSDDYIQIIVGSIAVKNSPKELAAAARKELDLAVGLFDNAPEHVIVRKGLVSEASF